jgi:DNA-binding FadR family transcriptional regulator
MGAQQVHVTIDRASPVPLYHQLAEQLTRSITEGQLQPGDPFENEVAVAERLQLSRPTVRRAIQELVDQGLLVRAGRDWVYRSCGMSRRPTAARCTSKARWGRERPSR